MPDNEYMPLEEEAHPTPESLQAAEQEGIAETRTCPECGQEVPIGSRVAVLTENGEEWRHPEHV